MTPATAAEPPATPILRVETGMHTTLIRRVVVDAPRNRVVTCSDDKTIRIWQLPEQRLVSTLRVPIDNGHEGQVFGIAISPDGKTLAAGGWTGWDWDGSASIYFFDVASGELTRRIGGLRDAIHALAWSPDGAHLAVGLQGRAGLDVLRVADGKVVASDRQYRDKLTDLDFDRNGRLAAASLDGMVRLYDAGFKLLGRRVVPGGVKPIAVRFSPDSAHLAVGFVDAPALAVVSGSKLDLEFSPKLDAAGQKSVFSVAWSSDGRHLYATGDFPSAERNPVYRWSEGGRGALERIPASASRITEIQQLPDNRMVYAAEDPGFGVIGADGRVEAFRAADILDFSGSHGRLLVSGDGAAVGYPKRRGDTASRYFAVTAGVGNRPDLAPAAKLQLPRLEAPGLRVEGWQNTFAPRINGKAPQLDDYEMARSYAIAPDGKVVLLGTEWALRLLDGEARQKWQVKLAAVAWSVNISRDGRLAVAALSDGTVRWYRMHDGAEVLAYFQHSNDDDWVAWLPDGHYISSIHGDSYVGWHINRGRDLTPDFIRAVQFDRILYRPDRVVSAFRAATGGSPEPSAASAFDIARIAEIAPTRLRVRPAGIETEGGRSRLKLDIIGEQGARPTEDLAIFINGIPVTPASERDFARSAGPRFVRSVTLPLHQRHNDIRVEAFNGLSLGIAETYLSLPDAIPVTPPTGDLYLLAIGVNDFPALGEDAGLLYAARDSEEFAKAMERYGAGHFRETHVRIVNDTTAEKPTKAVIQQALRFVQQASADDTVVIFLASHGISDRAGNYYFVPRDALPGDLTRLARNEPAGSMIPWTAFFDTLRRTAGRRLLVVDTCQARNIEGRFESHSLLKRSAASLFSLMLASKGDEESQEYPDAQHGLFTYALLSALSDESDTDRDGYLSQSELFKAAVGTVDSLRDKAAGPQTPQLVAPKPLRELPVARLQQK